MAQEIQKSQGSALDTLQVSAVELRKILQRASYEYYALDAPTMEDSVYDALLS